MIFQILAHTVESAVPNTEFLEYYGTENVTFFLLWAREGVLNNVTIYRYYSICTSQV